MSDELEKQSLNGENLSDYLRVESNELESMYAATFPTDDPQFDNYLTEDLQIDLNFTTDGPVKKNAANKQARRDSTKM